jgi:hypothetical protein
MDFAVLEAYEWQDLSDGAKCEFILDFENDEGDEEGVSSGRSRKKPWRYRWPDDFRDEVLARLLELNRTRAQEEANSLPAAPAPNTSGKRGRKSSKVAPVASPNLFEVQEPTE